MSDKKPVDKNPVIDSPFLIGEYRGVLMEEIKWREKKMGDGTTREAGSMTQAVYSVEMVNGIAVHPSQAGRAFTGVYDLQRGKRYAFKISVYKTFGKEKKDEAFEFSHVYDEADFIDSVKKWGAPQAAAK